MKRESRYLNTLQRVLVAEKEQGIRYLGIFAYILETKSKKDLELRTDCNFAEITMGVPIIAPEYR